MAPEFREWLIAFGDSGYAVLYQVDGEQAVRRSGINVRQGIHDQGGSCAFRPS
jgi:hypothetical protein